MAKKTYKTGSGKTPYPSDATDEEWAFCAPYLTLMKEDAPQRAHPLRAVFNAVRYLVRVGCPWHMIPNDFPPSSSVDQQVQRWIAAGCFEALAQDLRQLLRMLAERPAQPSAATARAAFCSRRGRNSGGRQSRRDRHRTTLYQSHFLASTHPGKHGPQKRVFNVESGGLQLGNR